MTGAKYDNQLDKVRRLLSLIISIYIGQHSQNISDSKYLKVKFSHGKKADTRYC